MSTVKVLLATCEVWAKETISWRIKSASIRFTTLWLWRNSYWFRLRRSLKAIHQEIVSLMLILKVYLSRFPKPIHNGHRYTTTYKWGSIFHLKLNECLLLITIHNIAMFFKIQLITPIVYKIWRWFVRILSVLTTLILA
jgi:hypothetical protein